MKFDSVIIMKLEFMTNDKKKISSFQKKKKILIKNSNDNKNQSQIERH